MSFWDNLTAAASAALPLTEKFVLNPLGAAWGIAQSANSIEESKSMGEMLAKLSNAPTNTIAGSIGVPGFNNQDSPLQSASRPLEYLVARPLSSAISAPFVADKDSSSIFDPKVWRDAWDLSANLSPGQSAIQSLQAGPQAWTNKPEDVQARKDFFENTWYGRASSGILDGLIDWFGDPLVVGGKAVKVAQIGKATLAAEHAPDAFKLLRGEADIMNVSKKAKTGADKLSNLIVNTDNMNFDQLMTHPVFNKTADSGAVAVLFDSANRITDPNARFAAKADILGVLQGDAPSMARMAQRRDELGAQVDRFIRPPGAANANVLFHVDDMGQMEIQFLNDPKQAQDILDHQDAIQAEGERLDRLWNAGKTSRVGGTPQEWAAFNLRQERMKETLLVDGPGSRPIRMIYTSLGARVPGHIDTNDVTKGYEDLSNVLSRDTYLTPAARQDILKRFADAPTKDLRGLVVSSAEQQMYAAGGRQFGLKPNEVQALFKTTTGVRSKWRAALEERAYTGKPTSIIGPDGEAIAYSGPGFSTQLQSTVPFTDPEALQWILKKNSQTRFIETMAQNVGLGTVKAAKLNNGVAATWDGMQTFLGTLMRPWKFMALFRPAYPQRIQVDTQLRMLSVLGPLKYAMSAKAGTVNLFKNLTETIPNPDFTAVLDSAQSKFDDINKLKNLTAKMGAGEFKDRRMLELDRQLAQAQAEVWSVPKRVRRVGTAEAATQLKEAEAYKGIDVTPARSADEYALINRKIGGDGTLARLMSDMSADQVAAERRSPGWSVMSPGDPNWEFSYLRDVNKQFRSSPTFYAALTKDDSELTQWIRENPQEWKNFQHIWQTPEEYSAFVRSQVNHYLPNDVLQATAAERQLRMNDVKEFFPTSADRMQIHGARYRYDWPQSMPFKDALTKFSNFWYKWASDVPEQVMGRHPLYNQRFRDHMKNQIDLTPGDYVDSNMVDRMRHNSDVLARRDVSNTLFDLTKMSGASDTFRLFSPFFSAWEDTMVKWGKLFLDDPSRAVHAAQMWNAPNAAGLVQDSEGYIIKDGKAYDPGTGQIVPAPKRGKGENIVIPQSFGFTGMAGFKIPKSSLNIVFQGDPAWLPGLGPLLEVPVNELAKRTSLAGQAQSNPVLRYFLPYGVTDENPLMQLAPSWVRQLEKNRPTSPEYAQQYSLFAAAEDANFRSGKRDKPASGDEISGMVNNYFLMRSFLNASAPVTVIPGVSPKLQFYVDQFHHIKNEYNQDPVTFKANHEGKDWEQVSYDKFPDYFSLAIDLSDNTTGIVASDHAYSSAQKLAKYIAPNPEYGWAIVGPDNTGTFDPNIRTAELSNSIGYGQSKTYRTQMNPIDAAKRLEAERGWIKYNQFMTLMNLAVEKRDPTGRTTLRAKVNQDLVAIKDAFVAQLGQENQSWVSEFGSTDEHKVDNFVNTMGTAAKGNTDFRNRADVQSLQQYLQARNLVTQVLNSRKSGNIDNPNNADVANVWNMFTNSLVQGNVGFERMYNRILVHDDLSRELLGSGIPNA